MSETGRWIPVKPGDRVELGRAGENLARTICFDIAPWRALFGAGTAVLLHRRGGDSAPYLCAIREVEDRVEWPVTAAETGAAQQGRYELQYRVGDILVKSCTGTTRVAEAMGDTVGPAPDPARSWVDPVLEAGEAAVRSCRAAQTAQEAAETAQDGAETARTEARQAADRAEAALTQAPAIGGNGNWFVGGEDTGVKATGPQGEQGPRGEPGETGAVAHAASHASAGSDPITPADIKALPAEGSAILDGSLYVRPSERSTFQVSCNSGEAQLISYRSDWSKRKFLHLPTEASGSAYKDLQFYDAETNRRGTVHHTANKPQGTYTGDATSRTVNVGGIGYSLVFIQGTNNWVGFATYYGTIMFQTTTGEMRHFPRSECNFDKATGLLTINTADDALNETGKTFYYIRL